MTLSEFLLARIAEDEAVVASEIWWSQPQPSHELLTQFGDFGDDERFMIEITAARVLAECDAKRRIIEWHKSWPVLVDTPPTFERGDGDLTSTTLRLSQHIMWLTEQEYRRKFGSEPPTGQVLRFLALPYADHPDYDEAWRP